MMMQFVKHLKQNRPSAHTGYGFLAISFIAIGASLGSSELAAQTSAPSAAVASEQLSVNDWLLKMHESSMKPRRYVGTMVQSSSAGMVSARIWHACDGREQIERVENLTGAPRSTVRHDNKLITFMPEIKTARVEKRELIGDFPSVLKPGANSIPDFYTVRSLGVERIAGHDADVVQLNPRDNLRFGYRLWTERKSDLVMKIQTLDSAGQVLEQAAFSEVQLDAPVKFDKLKSMMKNTEGWRIDKPEISKTTAAAEGWQLKSPVPGFKPVSCFKRTSPASVQAIGTTGAAAAPSESTMQWIFSDGLATVSLFVESYDKSRHGQEGMAMQGATHTLMKRMDDHFLMVVGEVPPQTLKGFAQALERKR
jgi:sigma-E factor negative regulatory protein RseB